jgi:hypothetical protein
MPSRSKTDEKISPWISLPLSILSLFLSGFALWYASLAPADIKASLSDHLVFHWEGGVPLGSPKPPGWGPAGLILVVNCSFANNGARVGEIKTMFLQLKDDKDGTLWVFEPWFIVDEEKLLDLWGQSHDQRTQTPWSTVAPAHFHSIVLPGKQTTAYSYLFRSDPNFSRNIMLGPPHTFQVTLFTASTGESEMRAQDREVLVLTPDYVNLVEQVPSVSLPFEGVRQMGEKTFKK